MSSEEKRQQGTFGIYMSDDSFLQGYMCAVATLISMNGLVTTDARELFRSGAGNKSLRELKECGLGENDLEIFEKHWGELYGT